MCKRIVWLFLVASNLVGLFFAPWATAQEKPSPEAGNGLETKSSLYATLLLSTSLAYRPHGGNWNGPQQDITPAIGIGYLVTEQLAIELDLGPTFAKHDYVGFGLVPGLLWLFHPNLYAAARFMVPIDPVLNLALFPGIGVAYPFESGFTPFLEAHVFSFIGKGEPDFGIALDLGITYLF